MSRNHMDIPAEDLKAINDSFKIHPDAETLGKDGSGRMLGAEKKLVNEREFEISDFRGRKLKHQKSLVPVDGKQIVIGIAGQMFDSVPLRLRNEVVWFESDFE